MCLEHIKKFFSDISDEFSSSITQFFGIKHDDSTDRLFDLGEENNRLMQYEKVQIEAKELFRKKNADYGDAFANYGPIGVMVRIGDKIGRLINIEKTKIVNVNDETLRDTLIDLHNYSAMAIMLMDEK